MGELTWAVEQYGSTAKDAITYSEYYHGKQRLMLSDEAYRLFGKLFGDIRYNVCATVVDTLSARLILTGFDCESEAAQVFLSDMQNYRRWQTLYSRVHREAARAGDAYVMVWPQDDGSPQLYLQPTGAMLVRYDQEADNPEIVEAVKFWYYADPEQSGKYIGRLTRYTPETVQRRVKTDSGGVPQLPDKLDSWQPYGEPSDFRNPYGKIPLFRFSNALDTLEFSQSELRDVLPLQDALNKVFVDTLIGGEYQGLAQRWVTGLDLDVDPETGERRLPFKAGGHRLWMTPSTEAKFGQFEAADLTKMLAVITEIEQKVARVSRTPYHLFSLNTGNFPSGEALKTAEAPLTEKIAERQAVWGDVWEDVMNCVLEQSGKPVEHIKAIWQDTTPRGIKESIEAAVMKLDLGVSKTKLRQELGYTADEIAEMDEQNAVDSRAVTDAAVRAFNAGGA